MASKQPKKVKVSELKGRKLYNYLVRELGVRNKKLDKKQQMGIVRRRKIVSTELYPKYKKLGNVTAKEINADLNQIIKGLPPEEICNPLYLSESYLAFIPYYDIDNHIRTVLPDCLDVRVSAGQYGTTKIFNTMKYNYHADGVRKIVEKIRSKIGELDSGEVPYFSGIIELKYRRKNNGSPDNYYVDYILYIQDEPLKDDSGVQYDLPEKEKKKVNEINDFLAQKFKQLQKEKRRKKRLAKKTQPKKPAEQKKDVNLAVKDALKSLKTLQQQGVISKADFERQKKKIEANKQKILDKQKPIAKKNINKKP